MCVLYKCVIRIAYCVFGIHVPMSGLPCAFGSRDVRGGAFSSMAGRGVDKNPRGGAKVKIRGAGRGGAKERVNRLIQKFDNSAYIVMEIFVVYYDVLINENIISSHF